MNLKILLCFFFFNTLVCISCAQDVIQLQKTIAGDATPTFSNLLNQAKQQNATKIIIPKGRYEFFPDQAFERYDAISNNDNGMKRIAFPLIDFKNLEIDGQGSEFIFHGQMIPFLIENSNSISIKNLSINWKRPHHSEGTVIAVDEKGKTFDLKMSSEFPYEIRGTQLIYIGENGYEQGLQENIFFDPAKGGVAYDDTRYVMDPWSKQLDYKYSAKHVGNGVVRILDTVATELPKVGWVFATKGNKVPNRLSPGFHIKRSKNISLSNVTIYHAGSMGVIAEKSEDIALTKIILTPPPGRMMSTASDATHFVGCKGEIQLIDCMFEYMHDDGTNVHSAYVEVVKNLDEHTLLVKLRHYQQFGFDFADAGDSAAFIDRQTLLPYLTLKVEDVSKINGEYSRISFKENISDLLKGKSALENISWYPRHVVVRGCTVRNNRARGILISTRGRVEVENNYLSNEMAGIFISGDANYWWESGAVEDVVIRNNVFENCATSKLDQSAILINANTLVNGDGCYHKNITIEGNTFKTFDRSVLRAHSVNGLRFNKNIIQQTKTFQPLYPDKSTLDIGHSKNVMITENSYTGDQPADIKMDEESKLKSVVKKNKGFK